MDELTIGAASAAVAARFRPAIPACYTSVFLARENGRFWRIRAE
jgi:hypothetical protein